MCLSWENSRMRRKEERQIWWRKWEKWVVRATVDKTRKISYQTILSFYRTYSSPPLLPFFFLSAECLSPGQPAYHYGNPLNQMRTHKKPAISVVTGQLPYHNHISLQTISKSAALPPLQMQARAHTHTHARARSDQSYRNPLCSKFAAS